MDVSFTPAAASTGEQKQVASAKDADEYQCPTEFEFSVHKAMQAGKSIRLRNGKTIHVKVIKWLNDAISSEDKFSVTVNGEPKVYSIPILEQLWCSFVFEGIQFRVEESHGVISVRCWLPSEPSADKPLVQPDLVAVVIKPAAISDEKK